jgi:hypothetical protein
LSHKRALFSLTREEGTTAARICRPMTEPFIKAFVYAAEQYSSQALDFGDAQMRRLFFVSVLPVVGP